MSKEVLEQLQAHFGDAIEATHSQAGDDTARVRREHWLTIAGWLKDELGFDMFIDLTAVDYLRVQGPKVPSPAMIPFKSEFEREQESLPRFEVVLHLRAMKTGKRIRLKARVAENECSIASLSTLWKGANWFERECHEFYGIKFIGHPDLRPLLLYAEFQGYPLRKDYPIDQRQPLVPLLAPETRRFGRPMDETKHGHEG
jgi:NADH-quinone oxidoreductase subunit C